jgi:hypothetical protein
MALAERLQKSDDGGFPGPGAEAVLRIPIERRYRRFNAAGTSAAPIGPTIATAIGTQAWISGSGLRIHGCLKPRLDLPKPHGSITSNCVVGPRCPLFRRHGKEAVA